jgi:hypothetical protein
MLRSLIPIAPASMAAAAALAAANPAAAAPREASIPFVNHQGILDWKAGDATTLYIQARDRKWYRATVLSSCRNLDFATRIGFDTGRSNLFDQSSYLLVEGQRCPVQSVVASGPPPKSAR